MSIRHRRLRYWPSVDERDLVMRAGPVLLAALWTLTLWFIGTYTLYSVIGFVILPIVALLWLVSAAKFGALLVAALSTVGAGQARRAGHVAVPIAIAMVALGYVAYDAAGLMVALR